MELIKSYCKAVWIRDLLLKLKAVSRCFLYVISIGIALWFLCTVLQITASNLPTYIPICTNLGIYLGVGINHILSESRESVRRALGSVCRLVLSTLGLDREPQPDLAVIEEGCSIGINSTEGSERTLHLRDR